jgi:hypothetical protein
MNTTEQGELAAKIVEAWRRLTVRDRESVARSLNLYTGPLGTDQADAAMFKRAKQLGLFSRLTERILCVEPGTIRVIGENRKERRQRERDTRRALVASRKRRP